MISLSKNGLVLASLAAILTYGSAAHAGYFVRPYVGFAVGAVQDGLDVNGVTSKTVGFSDAFRSANSTVDLATGSLKGFAAQNGEGFSYFNSIMGDTITFRGGAGTTWDFDFTLDGSLSTVLGPQAPGNNSTSGVAYSLSFAVFRPGQVTYADWFSKAGGTVVPLFFENQDYQFSFPGDNPNGSIFQTISGNLALQSNEEIFEIYARIFASASADTATGLVSSGVDLSHTGKIDFDFSNSVSAYSDSGVFLGLARDPGVVNGVPEPGSLALVLAGVIGLVGVARKRRS